MAINLQNYEPALRANSDITTTGALTVGSLASTAGITATTVSGTGIVTAVSGTAPVAAGSQVIQATSTANLGIFVGSGAPTVSAAQGSLYLRTDGSSTSTRLYVNSNGSTTWVAVTTAS